MKHTNKHRLQATAEKGKISTQKVFVIDVTNKTVKPIGLIKRNARGSVVSCNANYRSLKRQGWIKRYARGFATRTASFYEANMTAVFNRESDETLRAMNTINNMSCNRTKVAEKYKGI